MISEIGYNTFLLMNLYSDRNVARFRTYEKEAQEQIEFLQQADKGYYRILQTTTRGNMGTHNITAHYNESVAFDYWGVGGYTSVPKNNQLKFLDRLGYRNEFDRMNIVNTSIVAADSLLGVKYVLSHEDIKGLIPLDEPDAYNKKKIYKNPYALPVAFIYETNNRRIDENSANPFIFTNEWYSKILNREVEVYHRVDFRKSETDKKIIYDMDPVPGKYSLYGNIRWKKTMEAVLHVNGKYKMPYSTWLSQSVFYIPVQEGIAPKVELSVKNDMDIEAEQFYGLNLEELGHISKKIQERKINGVKIENGIVEVKIYGRDDQSLYLSIPYDRGWELTNNRNRVQPEVIGGCMISIPLQNGMNDIRMEYKLPLFREGLGLSILGIFCLIGYGFYGKKYHKNG